MKMYKKSELTLVDGMLVAADGDIVQPDIEVVVQANSLETLKQKTAFLAAQPEATPMPSLDGFERKSIGDGDIKLSAHTPTLDKQAEEAVAMMDELDDMVTVSHANAMIEDYSKLLAFAKADYVIDCGSQGLIHLFDTPTLGSVLDLTQDAVLDVIFSACGMDKDALLVKGDMQLWSERMSDGGSEE